MQSDPIVGATSTLHSGPKIDKAVRNNPIASHWNPNRFRCQRAVSRTRKSHHRLEARSRLTFESPPHFFLALIIV
jgi:hypothetical protein